MTEARSLAIHTLLRTDLVKSTKAEVNSSPRNALVDAGTFDDNEGVSNHAGAREISLVIST